MIYSMLKYGSFGCASLYSLLAIAPIMAQPLQSGEGEVPRRTSGSAAESYTLAKTNESGSITDESAPESDATDTLAKVLDDVYHTSPRLQMQRYELRAKDANYAVASTELNLATSLELNSAYSKTIPGRTTQRQRFLADSPIVTKNSLDIKLAASQPIFTGGRASANQSVALNEISATRAQLRALEGDLLLQVITNYVDIRRDRAALRLRADSLNQMSKTKIEAIARREAGELTRTDVALAEAQLKSAQIQYETAVQQLQSDLANFVMLVGREPGTLSEPPDLPNLPANLSEAYSIAEEENPDFAEAVATEAASRDRIALAAAYGKPSMRLAVTASMTGQATPFYFNERDQEFNGQVILSIPLTSGGRVRAEIAQATDRNSVDRLRIEVARRTIINDLFNAWTAVITTRQNIQSGMEKCEAARINDEGTFEEYRAGLRSTFDVIYAHVALRDCKIDQINASRDLYVTQAALLRRMGRLEVRALLAGSSLYNPDEYFREAKNQSLGPLDAVARYIDGKTIPHPIQPGIVQPPQSTEAVSIVPAGTSNPVSRPPSTWPIAPAPGTIGAPSPSHSVKKP